MSGRHLESHSTHLFQQSSVLSLQGSSGFHREGVGDPESSPTELPALTLSLDCLNCKTGRETGSTGDRHSICSLSPLGKRYAAKDAPGETVKKVVVYRVAGAGPHHAAADCHRGFL